MTAARAAWLLHLLLHLLLIGLLIAAGPWLWLPALPLLIVLPWLIRQRLRAHGFNILLVLWYIGGGLVFRDTAQGLAIACTAAAAFLAGVVFIRLRAAELRRRAGEAAMAAADGERVADSGEGARRDEGTGLAGSD